MVSEPSPPKQVVITPPHQEPSHPTGPTTSMLSADCPRQNQTRPIMRHSNVTVIKRQRLYIQNRINITRITLGRYRNRQPIFRRRKRVITLMSRKHRNIIPSPPSIYRYQTTRQQRQSSPKPPSIMSLPSPPVSASLPASPRTVTPTEPTTSMLSADCPIRTRPVPSWDTAMSPSANDNVSTFVTVSTSPVLTLRYRNRQTIFRRRKRVITLMSRKHRNIMVKTTINNVRTRTTN